MTTLNPVQQKLALVLGVDDKALKGGLSRAQASLNRFDSAMTKWGKRGALAAAGIATGIVVMGSKFEQEMLNIRTMQKMTNEEFDNMSMKVLDLSRKIPKSAGDISRALYQVVSAQVPVNQQFEALEWVSKAATGGLANMEETALLLTRSMRSYAEEGLTFERAADVMFKTVEKGQTRFAELASSFGPLLPMAKKAGVTFEETAAGVATLTLAGFETAEAVTALGRMFQALAAPQDQAAEAMRKMGVEVLDAHNRILPLGEVIKQFAGVSLKELREMIPQIRGARGLAGLSDAAEQYDVTLKAMIESHGAAQYAFEQVSSSVASTWKRIRNIISAAAIKIFYAIRVDINEALKQLEERLDKVNDWVVGHKDEIVNAGRDIIEMLKSFAEKMGKIIEYAAQHPDALKNIFVIATLALITTKLISLTTAVIGLTTAMKGMIGAKIATGLSTMGTALTTTAAGMAGVLTGAAFVGHKAGKATYEAIKGYLPGTEANEQKKYNAELAKTTELLQAAQLLKHPETFKLTPGEKTDHGKRLLMFEEEKRATKEIYKEKKILREEDERQVEQNEAMRLAALRELIRARRAAEEETIRIKEDNFDRTRLMIQEQVEIEKNAAREEADNYIANVQYKLNREDELERESQAIKEARRLADEEAERAFNQRVVSAALQANQVMTEGFSQAIEYKMKGFEALQFVGEKTWRSITISALGEMQTMALETLNLGKVFGGIFGTSGLGGIFSAALGGLAGGLLTLPISLGISAISSAFTPSAYEPTAAPALEATEFGGGIGGGADTRRAGATVQAREVKYNISPSLTFDSGGGPQIIGPRSLEEVGDTLNEWLVGAIIEATKTGEYMPEKIIGGGE